MQHQRFARLVTVGLMPALLVGCMTQITTRLQPSPAIGMESLAALGSIERRKAAIGLYIAPNLRGLEESRELTQGHTVIVPIGSPFSAKLLQGLSYTFERVALLDKPELTPDLNGLMNVELVSSHVDLVGSRNIWSGQFTSQLSIILEVKATLTNRNGDVVWVGTGAANQTGETTYTAYDAGSSSAAFGLNEPLNRAIDAAVTQIVSALKQSESLRRFIAELGAK